jgi:hypothetical protein
MQWFKKTVQSIHSYFTLFFSFVILTVMALRKEKPPGKSSPALSVIPPNPTASPDISTYQAFQDVILKIEDGEEVTNEFPQPNPDETPDAFRNRTGLLKYPPPSSQQNLLAQWIASGLMPTNDSEEAIRASSQKVHEVIVLFDGNPEKPHEE